MKVFLAVFLLPLVASSPQWRRPQVVFFRNQYEAPTNQYGSPDNQYGAPDNQYGAPDNQYGAPAPYKPSGWRPAIAFTLPNQRDTEIEEPQQQAPYPPSGGYHYGPPTTPAAETTTTDLSTTTEEPSTTTSATTVDPESETETNYEYEYNVDDNESGSSFGQRESRKGDVTQGTFHVLLPDGRLQRVTYTAGAGGFRANVQYEEPGKASTAAQNAPKTQRNSQRGGNKATIKRRAPTRRL